MQKLSLTLLATVLCSSSAIAQSTPPAPTVIGDCPRGHEPAWVQLNVSLSTTPDCPVLEERGMRKLVNKFATGAIFAYPMAPGTCLTGSNLSGVITLLATGHPILVEGSTVSAQQIFPEALAVGNGVFVSGANENGTFASGAATTVVTLHGTSEPFNLQIVTDDRFTLDYANYPVVDTETFLIMGSLGSRNVVGRLTGVADIYAAPQTPLANVQMTISGAVCMK